MFACSHDDDSLTCLSVFFLRLTAHGRYGQVVVSFAKCHRHENAIFVYNGLPKADMTQARLTSNALSPQLAKPLTLAHIVYRIRAYQLLSNLHIMEHDKP